jgi:hypothetical protein
MTFASTATPTAGGDSDHGAAQAGRLGRQPVRAAFALGVRETWIGAGKGRGDRETASELPEELD